MHHDNRKYTSRSNAFSARSITGASSGEPICSHCRLRGKVICIIAYFEGDVGEDEIETIRVVASEVIADFPEPYYIEESCLSPNEHKLEMLDFWAFRRKSYEDKM
jgi:hypothetical protein